MWLLFIILKNMTKVLYLTSSGLKNIILNNHEPCYRFIFRFGQREIETNKYFAEFISPVISHLHQCDPTIDFINFEDMINENGGGKRTKQRQQFFTSDSISLFERILSGSAVEIPDKDQMGLRIISILLGNNELYENLLKINPQYIANKPIDELIDEVTFYYEFCAHDIEYSDIIDRLSRDFWKIDSKLIDRLPIGILYRIIANENFVRNSEDDFYDVISKVQTNDEESKIMIYESIDFKNLSSSKFSEFIDKFDYREMTKTIWDKLCECFYINHDGKEEEEERKKGRRIEFDGKTENRLKGIIQKLTEEAGGNVSDKGIVDVTSSSTFSDYYPKNAVDLNNISNYYESINDTYDQWLRYDFKERKIRPTGYSIRTRHNSDCFNPQSWCIEVSNTGNDNDWKIVDSRTNATSLQKGNQLDTFEIGQKLHNNESYRFIRLRQTGQSTYNSNYLVISALEYFGELLEN